MIADALNRAATDHVVYFLLTSYVDARIRDDMRGDIPDEVKLFPIAAIGDVQKRLEALERVRDNRKTADALILEALHVFSAAAAKLTRLDRPAPATLTTRKRVFG